MNTAVRTIGMFLLQDPWTMRRLYLGVSLFDYHVFSFDYVLTGNSARPSYIEKYFKRMELKSVNYFVRISLYE